MNCIASVTHLLRLACVSAMGLAAATPVFSASLEGATVTTAVYCCVAPTENYRISSVVSAVVGEGVELPVGTLETTVSGRSVIPLNVDIGADYVELDYTGSATASSGSFNGYVFAFEGAADIVGVSVNAASTFLPTDFWFTADTLYVDVANLRLNSSSRLLLDIALAPVPEPSSWAQFAGGLGLIGMAAARRKRVSA